MKRIFYPIAAPRCSPCRCSARPPRWRMHPGRPLDRFRLRSLRVGTALGRVNLTSTYLQPVGTPLGASVFDLTSGTRYPDPNKVLYECDAGDAGRSMKSSPPTATIASAVITIRARDGNPNYYATYFPYVGIRLTHLDSGKVLPATGSRRRLPATPPSAAKFRFG